MLIVIRAILEQSMNNKTVSKTIKVGCLQLEYIYTNSKLVAICKNSDFEWLMEGKDKNNRKR